MLKPVTTYHDDTKTQIYERYFIDESGHEQGQYESYHDNGHLFIRCTYRDGKPDGPYKDCYTNGQLRLKCTYRDGKLDGSYDVYHKDGHVWKKYTYRNGALNGPCEIYWHNGRLYEKYTCRNGKKNGPYIRYSEMGQVEEKGVFVNDIFVKGEGIYHYALEQQNQVSVLTHRISELQAQLQQKTVHIAHRRMDVMQSVQQEHDR